MRNVDVARQWSMGRSAHSLHMHSDGARLYSYALLIGEWRDGLPVVFNYTAHDDVNPFGHIVPSEGFYSVTTSAHVSLARRFGYCFQVGDTEGPRVRKHGAAPDTAQFAHHARDFDPARPS